MPIDGRRLALAAGGALVLYAARRYFRDWGTTKSESRMHLPGDELIREPMLRITEAVWIERPAAAVWPWLVQMGQDRGGLYSYELLENSIALHHRNANRIHPEWQHLAQGDVIRLAPRGWLRLPDGLALSVAVVVEERAMVLRGAPPGLPWETVWSFHLIPHGDDRCRVLVRTRVGLRYPGEVLLTEAVEPVTALMTRGMLRGIRRRAERAPIRPRQSPTPTSPTG
jgi:hypothetical protein